MGDSSLFGRRALLRAPGSTEYDTVAEWLTSNPFGDVAMAPNPGRHTGRTLRRAIEAGHIDCLVIDANNVGPVGAVTWRTARHSRSFEVSVVIGDPADWQQGYGAEALIILLDLLFQTLDAWRVQFTTAAINAFTILPMTRRRLTIEGVLRDAIYLDGEYHDLTVWSILRPEYLSQAKDHEMQGIMPFEPRVSASDKAKGREALTHYLAGTPNAAWLRR
ncbi:GNAT family N-acetyltransferase [Arthrobacter sp. ISL-69]|uniref:GNAT family N-acetyltransferase n=1 Tax=Arthrobacter sp. ISL-69 TaxID=2819113 RepID=UPI001BE7D0A2|nr:GNAT family protein [Arthrobacter sp. ISL-69]MBT2536269.1 GNAT family N-acetyltransferase [Arthrobacter sp. ISL-69]